MPCRARSPETAHRAPHPAAHTMPPGRARRPVSIPTLPFCPPHSLLPAWVPGPSAHDLLRVLGYLLHAPVVHVSHKYRVLGRASQSMRPVELAHTMARLPEHAENLAVQRHLVEPTRLGVDDEYILGRSRRDAQGPRGSLVRHCVGVRGRIPQHGVPGFFVWRIQMHEAYEDAIPIIAMNSPVAAVRGIHVSLPVGLLVVGIVDVVRILIGVGHTLAVLSPGLDPIAVPVELGHARVHIAVAHEDVVILVPGDIGWRAEPAIHGYGLRLLEMLLVTGVVPFRPSAQVEENLSRGVELDD